MYNYYFSLIWKDPHPNLKKKSNHWSDDDDDDDDDDDNIVLTRFND